MRHDTCAAAWASRASGRRLTGTSAGERAAGGDPAAVALGAYLGTDRSECPVDEKDSLGGTARRTERPAAGSLPRGDIMSADEDRDARDEEARRRQNRYWAIGMTIALVAFGLFLISIYEDPGPICGTGQDKGPC